ncbi:MAG: methyltransferase domain-containing protein [Anaerolineales bacterium]|nr:methyltransferase domain-containing protein [Anaerolineales bacterium]
MSESRPPICDYEGSDYQEKFWEQGSREYEDRVEAIALQRLLPEGGSRLLEVGAGAGRNTSRYKGYQQIVLLDYSRTQIELAQKQLGESERYIYVVGDVYRLPFAQETFDAATMIRTLHHLVEPQKALSQIRPTLVPGSTFILEYANKRNLKAIARWAFRRQEWSPFDSEAIEFTELNFNFHPRIVYKWLNEAGFSPGRKLTVSHFRINLLKRHVPLNVLVALDSIMQRTGNCIQLTPSVFQFSSVDGAPGRVREGSIWRCPECASLELQTTPEGLSCKGCRRIWPVKNGIYDFKNPL